MSKITLWLLSFKEDKTKELLLDPLLILLNDSNKFKYEHFEKSVYSKGVTSDGIIHYSEAGKFGAISTPKLKLATGRDPSNIVGSDIISGVISELSFFKTYAPGFTDEKAKEVFTKLRNRIKNTIGDDRFPCWTYIDTSANDADSPLESYILNDLAENSKYYFRHYCLWEVRPHLFPIWNQDRSKTFKICIGDGTYPAKVLSNSSEWGNYPTDLLLDVPIDLLDEFKNDLINQIRDTAGRPTTSESKFIQSTTLIDEIFEPTIQNEEGGIICDAKSPPQNLIFSKIIDKYIVKFMNQKFLKRANQEHRYCGIDLAYAVKGDVQGLSIGHKEFSRATNNIIYVSDFTFPILSGENGINIEAVGYFIKELNDIGVGFQNVVFDTFQSEALAQFLTRNNIPCHKQSVDTSIAPYMNFYTLLLGGQIKSGKNIFLKNNLNSLYRVKNDKGVEKIDHSKGTLTYIYTGNWEYSECGLYAKDVSDAFVNWVYTASQDNISPRTIFEDENERIHRIITNLVDPNLVKIKEKNFKKLLI